MKTRVASLLMALVLIAMVHGRPAQAAPRKPEYVPGEVIIKFRANVAETKRQQILRGLGARDMRELKGIHANRLKLGRLKVDQAVERYKNDPAVQYIEPNYIYHGDFVPNDAMFGQLWGMQNTGQSGGTPGADISAVPAWDVTTGSSDVLVAMIDTGIDYTHPDLADNIYTNPGEIPDNGIDDDHNGFVDDVRGWDFVNNDNNPYDDNSHGTHTAGTVGAIGNNGIGVAGVSWHVKLLPLKFLNSSGSGTLEDAVDAIHYATMMGARIMSNSWGGGGFSQSMLDAIQEANDAGVLFVAAAGNDGADNDVFPHYPANYDVPNVIAVAATDRNDQLAYFSDYGHQTVDLAAPGVDVLSTIPGGSYASYDGTSMATPHVSGALALILARFPLIGAIDAKNLLLNNVDHLANLNGITVTGGRLNALLPVAPADSLAPDPIHDLAVASVTGSGARLTWTATGDDGSTGRASRYDIRWSQAPITQANFGSAHAVSHPPNPQPAGVAEHVDVTGLAFSTTYYFAALAVDELGNPSTISNVPFGTTLGPPDVAVTPDSIHAELFTGEHTTRTITISNTGVSDLVWDIRITSAAGAMGSLRHPAPPPGPEPVPLRTWQVLGDVSPDTPHNRTTVAGAVQAVKAVYGEAAAQPNILLYSDEASLPAGQQYGDLALQALGLPYTAVYNDPATFGNALAAGGWDLVIVDHENYYGIGQYWSELEAYLNQGGRLLLGTFDIDGSHSEPTTLWSTIGLAPAGDLGVPSPLYWWQPSHPLFNRPEVVPPFTQFQEFYLDDGDRVTALPGADSPAGFVPGGPVAGQSGIVINSAGTAVVNSFVIAENTSDLDFDGIPDGVELLKNEIQYLRRALWLSADPASGVVPPGQSVNVPITFDATGLNGGEYFQDVVVVSNDPDEPEARVGARLHVTGAPDLRLSATSLDYDTLFVGASRPDTIVAENAGTDVLHVSGVSVDHADFTVDPSGFDLNPGDEHLLIVTFHPSAPTSVAGTLSITSDDPDTPKLAVGLSGQGLLPPEIGVTPDSLRADLFTGEQTTRQITIRNTGASNLVWRASIANVGPALAGGAPAARPGGAAARRPAPALEGGASHLPDPSAPRSDRRPDNEVPVVTHPLTMGGAATLLIEDLAPWGTTSIEDVLYANGIKFDVINSSQLAATSLDHYGLVIIPSDQPTSYYLALRARAAQLDHFVYTGGILEVHGAGEGHAGGDASQLILPEGLQINLNYAFSNHVLLPGHPLMAGVPDPFTGNYASHGYFTNIPAGATQIAAEETGRTNLVTYAHGSGTVIALGQTVEWGYAHGEDTGRILTNLIPYAHHLAPQWLAASPPEGVILPGGSAVVTVTFNAAGLFGGHYFADVRIQSNDPDEAEVVVPAHLHVTGAPDLLLSANSLEFGSLFIGFTRTDTLVATNQGTDVLHVAAVAVNDADYLVDTSPFNLAPGASRTLPVTFRPTRAQVIPATLTLTSDDPDQSVATVALHGEGLLPPDIAVAPASLDLSLFTGEQATRPLTISNTGASPLTWSVEAQRAEAAQVVQSSPKFVSTPRGAGEKTVAKAPPAAPAPSATYAPERVATTRDESARGPVAQSLETPLEEALAHLDVGYLDVTGAIPNRYDFSEGEAGNSIIDGGNDMYDGGNFLSTDRGGPVDYSNGVVRSSPAFGAAGRYFTRKYPGLFVMVADLDDVGAFTISGNVGADGSGNVDGAVLAVDIAGLRYLGFVKRTYNAGDPSVNHLIIVAEHPGQSHTFATNSDDDFHSVVGLSGTTRLFDVLYAGQSGSYIDNVATLNIMTRFLQTLRLGPGWLSLQPSSGVVPSGGVQGVIATFDARGLIGGDYLAHIAFHSDDPDEQEVIVPASLHVTGAPDVDLSRNALSFGPNFIGATKTDTVAVRNAGTDVLHVSSVGSDQAAFTVSTAGFNLPPGGTRVLLVSFHPSAVGPVAGTLTVTSDDPDEGTVGIPMTGEGLVPPAIDVTPASIDALLVPDAQEDRVITIVNHGGADLSFQVNVESGAPAVQTQPVMQIEKGHADPRHGEAVTLGLGGPDRFGYRWIDSDQPGGPVFNWVEISGFGTRLPLLGDDGNYGPFPIGFGFPFYGNTFTQFRACTNGWISFTSSSATYSNQPLPTAFAPENLLAIFWDDLYFPDMRAYSYFDGSRLIIEYTNIPNLGVGGPYTFEILLYPNGRIVYQYLQMTAPANSATVGIQNALGDDGLTVAFNNNYVHGGLAVEFSTGPRWITVQPTNGVVHPGQSLPLNVHLDATGLLGVYQARLEVANNDPLAPEVTVPVSLRVARVPIFSAAPDPVDFGTVYVGYPRTRALTVKNVGGQTLTVSGITAGHADYSVAPTAFSLAAGESTQVQVTLAPSAPGDRSSELLIVSNATGSPHHVGLVATADLAPVGAVTPSVLERTVVPGGVSTGTIRICNTGGSNLTYSTRVVADPAASAQARGSGATFDASSANAAPVASAAPSGPRSQSGGGPDAFGYSWLDSHSAGGPTFSWIDVSGIGTPIPFSSFLDQGNVGPIPIGFPFSFYGQTFTSIQVCTNGWISFTNPSVAWQNQPLPNNSPVVPENLIAPFWDDLTFSTDWGSSAYYHSDGNRLVVQYNSMLKNGIDRPDYTFEVVLWRDGRIQFQYRSFGPSVTSATVGIQNQTKDDGLTVVHNAAYLQPGLAIEFARGPSWADLSPRSGVVPPGGCADLTVTMDATGLDLGDYFAHVQVTTNDPANPESSCPLRLHVVNALVGDLDVDPNSLNTGSGGRWITAYLELPAPYSPADVSIPSVRLNGSVAADPTNHSIGDNDHDGIPDLMLKFPRAEVIETLPEIDDVTMNLTATLTGGRSLEAQDVTHIVRPHLSAPNGGESLTGGATYQVRWSVPSGWHPDRGELLLSADGGITWSTIASNVTGTSYGWAVPTQAVPAARLKVKLYDADGLMGLDSSDGPFAILASPAATGGADRPAVESLRQNQPNPFRGMTRIGFDLPRSTHVRLAVYDMAGRFVRRLADGTLPEGRHELSWDGRDDQGNPVHAGIYFYRLDTAESRFMKRMVLVD